MTNAMLTKCTVVIRFTARLAFCGMYLHITVFTIVIFRNIADLIGTLTWPLCITFPFRNTQLVLTHKTILTVLIHTAFRSTASKIIKAHTANLIGDIRAVCIFTTFWIMAGLICTTSAAARCPCNWIHQHSA